MRIFEHRIFSKSFGGKIRHNWTDVTYRIKKKRRMRIISTRIFLSFLAGKIKIFEQPLIQPFRATKNCSWKSPTKSRNNISLHFSSDSPCFERNIPILFCSSVKSCLSLLFDSRLKHQRYSPFILQEIENNW